MTYLFESIGRKKKRVPVRATVDSGKTLNSSIQVQEQRSISFYLTDDFLECCM